jgi:GNAT superfamily N-acetyltransferase
MKFLPVSTDPKSLDAYAGLFHTCFPGASIADPAYLIWLYSNNPAGPVVGFDAWDGETLAAHYACIPADMTLDGKPVRCLLSLNTATDPRYQGQGLFTRLAAETYDHAAQAGFAAVYGVANANSTPGFLRKLSFQMVAPLAARLGFGRLTRRNWPELAASASFSHRWTAETLHWRISNPRNPVRLRATKDQALAVYAPTGRPGLIAYGELPMVADWPNGPDVAGGGGGLSARVFVGLLPGGGGGSCYGPIPKALKPSPLNLIYRPLDPAQAPPQLDPNTVLITFLDFDAF